MTSLRLEPFKLTDIDRLISWLDSPQVFWYWTGDWLTYPLTIEQYAPRVLETIQTMPNRLIFKAVQNATDIVVGHFEISMIDRSASTATIGRVIVNPQHRGQGVCREMMALGVAYAQHQLGIHHLDIQVAEDNSAAIRCYLSAGFNDDGPMREDARLRWMSLEGAGR